MSSMLHRLAFQGGLFFLLFLLYALYYTGSLMFISFVKIPYSSTLPSYITLSLLSL